MYLLLSGLSCCLGFSVVFCCLGGGRVLFFLLFGHRGGGRWWFHFLLFGPGACFIFCYLGGVRVSFFAVRAGCFFFALRAGTGVHSLTGLPGWALRGLAILEKKKKKKGSFQKTRVPLFSASPLHNPQFHKALDPKPSTQNQKPQNPELKTQNPTPKNRVALSPSGLTRKVVAMALEAQHES